MNNFIFEFMRLINYIFPYQTFLNVLNQVFGTNFIFNTQNTMIIYFIFIFLFFWSVVVLFKIFYGYTSKLNKLF